MTMFERFLRFLGFTPTTTAYAWKSKISTWIGILQVCLGAAVVAWTQLPAELRTEVPRDVVAIVSAATVLLGFLAPLFTNVAQPKLQAPKLPE